MRPQRRLRTGIEPQAAQTQPRPVLLQKMPSQQQHVRFAFAQRRHDQRIDTEPVVKVGAKAACAHFLRQVAVGRGNHAHIHVVLTV